MTRVRTAIEFVLIGALAGVVAALVAAGGVVLLAHMIGAI